MRGVSIERLRKEGLLGLEADRIRGVAVCLLRRDGLSGFARLDLRIEGAATGDEHCSSEAVPAGQVLELSVDRHRLNGQWQLLVRPKGGITRHTGSVADQEQ